jgi:thiosulfate/3-mercaptopyruvate sulfurtransferase
VLKDSIERYEGHKRGGKIMKISRKMLHVSFLFFIIALTAPAVAADLEGKVVGAEWLMNNLERPDIRVVDTRDNVTEYWQGHIPGAVYMHPEVMRLADRGVPVKLTPPKVLATMLGEMGVGTGTTVVVYTEKGGFKGPYLVWALDYLGHESAAVLEGGFADWLKKGLPVTQDYPEILPMKYPLPKTLQGGVRASLDDVRAIVESGGGVILDVRPFPLYTGEKGFWKRRGHIKGSLSRFWGEDLDEDGKWKDSRLLKAEYEKLGVTHDKKVITSCGQGQMSAHTYFTLKYILGYPDVRNYDGSFNEWSNIEDLPVETGTMP